MPTMRRFLNTGRRALEVIVLAAAVGLLPALVAADQELVELRDAFLLEARLLDADIEEYAEARRRESQAIEALQGVNRRLDAAMADPNASPAELLRLEDEVAAAREAAWYRSVEAGEARRGLLRRMERLADLTRQVQAEGVVLVPRSGAVGGMWRVEAQPIGVYGLLSLEQEGSLVSGTYRLSNGRRGSLQGTFAGVTLQLEMVDSERGLIGSIEGDLDRESGEIRGRWQAMELAGNRPSGGTWTARLVSLEETLGLDR